MGSRVMNDPNFKHISLREMCIKDGPGDKDSTKELHGAKFSDKCIRRGNSRDGATVKGDVGETAAESTKDSEGEDKGKTEATKEEDNVKEVSSKPETKEEDTQAKDGTKTKETGKEAVDETKNTSKGNESGAKV